MDFKAQKCAEGAQKVEEVDCCGVEVEKPGRCENGDGRRRQGRFIPKEGRAGGNQSGFLCPHKDLVPGRIGFGGDWLVVGGRLKKPPSPFNPTKLPKAMSYQSLVTAAISYAALTISSHAVLIYGLGTGGQIYSFDSGSPLSMTPVGTATATGIVDIDFRKSNGKLYGIAGNGNTSTININSGLVTNLFSPSHSLGGTVSGFDFNPAADRMRIAVNGTNNFRMVPDGIVGMPQGTVVSGATGGDGLFLTPMGVTLLDVAYTNPFSGSPATTTLFSIGSDGILYTHPAAGGPTFNMVAAVGSLGFVPVGDVSFDIDASGLGYMTNGTTLYTVDLGTGLATSLGTLGQGLTSIAIVPEPSGVAFGGIAGLALLRRSRRA